ncbi:MAG: hypothetical protein Q9M23_05280, partial [Mariprofundaceae bacterium]|nr:hypothetical protein [Mariprofundaceae bacterium]
MDEVFKIEHYLNSKHFPTNSISEAQSLDISLKKILNNDFDGNMFTMMGSYQRILADNCQRERWPEMHGKLEILFKCGSPEAINGPMIGIPVSIRDSDYFKEVAELTGKNRSVIANLEWMATAWNATFADTGLWMGKTFEPVSRETVAEKTGNDPEMMDTYDEESTRIGRNFFRQPPNPNALQAIGLPALTELWKLKERPVSTEVEGYDSKLLAENLQKEKAIPYSKTGGYFLCNPGASVVPEMKGKEVYQLNYRWPDLGPTYPMTRLVDEIIRIDDGIYLGQLVFASRHYSLGTFTLPGGQTVSLGDRYPHHSQLDNIERILPIDLPGNDNPYGYQNNGFFLMIDPNYAKKFYADGAFPQLRPSPGEIGFQELEYDTVAVESKGETVAPTDARVQSWPEITDWAEGWKSDEMLKSKFTTFILEESPKGDADGDVATLLNEGESVLQMLQRISGEISSQSNPKDQLKHFDKLNRLFRRGVAPTVENGLFQGRGKRGYNTRVESVELHDWYGEKVRS